MLEAQPQDKRGELYLFPNPQKRVAISGAAGVCGKSSPPRKEKKKEREQEEFIRNLMCLEGKCRSHWKRDENKQQTNLMEKIRWARVV